MLQWPEPPRKKKRQPQPKTRPHAGMYTTAIAPSARTSASARLTSDAPGDGVARVLQVPAAGAGEADLVAVREVPLGDDVAVHAGLVGGAEVEHRVAGLARLDARVRAGDERLVHPDVGVLVAAHHLRQVA